MAASNLHQSDIFEPKYVKWYSDSQTVMSMEVA